MVAPEPFRRLRVLPRRHGAVPREERSLPEPPQREPARQISVVLPLQRTGEVTPVPTLLSLQPLRAAGHEVILVHDAAPPDTVELVTELVDQMVEGPSPVAQQLNLGARYAWGEQLLFLRPGCLLPEHADRLILAALEKSGAHWGCFAISPSGSPFYSWLVRQPVHWRSRLLGIVAAEQGIFVRRFLFDQVGGFPDVPGQESVAISKLLKQSGPPVFLRTPLVVAARKG